MNSRASIMGARVFRAIVAPMILDLGCCSTAAARNYLFENITDLPAGPGGGRSAEINDDGDIAFLNGETVWFYDRGTNSFLDVTSLPGAPANPFFVKLNNHGDIAIVETPTTSRDLWFFEQETQEFTNISALPTYPGDSFASFPLTAFDLNDNNQISFHSGDNNFGDVYVYDHASGEFDRVTGMPQRASLAPFTLKRRFTSHRSIAVSAMLFLMWLQGFHRFLSKDAEYSEWRAAKAPSAR